MKTPRPLSAFISFVLLAASLVYPGGTHAAPGDLYVTDSIDGVIFKFTPGGERSTFAIGLTAPRGLAFDRSGNLFVADASSGLVLRFAPEGTRSTFASGLRAPFDVAFDRFGNLLVAESNGDSILQFTPAGTRLPSFRAWRSQRASRSTARAIFLSQTLAETES